MALSCQLRITHCVSQQDTTDSYPFFSILYLNKSFLDQACSVKKAKYKPNVLINDFKSVLCIQKKNLANIQPFLPGLCFVVDPNV